MESFALSIRFVRKENSACDFEFESSFCGVILFHSKIFFNFCPTYSSVKMSVYILNSKNTYNLIFHSNIITLFSIN